MKKNNLKLILVILIICVLISGLSVYATYSYLAKDVSYTKKDGTTINVGDALNELYNRNTGDVGYIEKIWSSSDQSVNYTYTVQEEGTYLIGIMNCNGELISGTITTNAQESIVKKIDCGDRWTSIKVVNANVGDNINVIGYNGRCTLNAFISKLNNINLKEVVSFESSVDKAATISYTATNEMEKILVVSFANGNSRSISTSYSGKYMASNLRDNYDYVDYVFLGKNATVTTSAYGYDWGGGTVIILK